MMGGMLTIYNDQHALHQGKVEMFRGELVPCFEVPARVDHVKHELERRGLGPLQLPDAFDEALLARVHAPRYLDFIAHAWDEWVALDPSNASRDALPSYWPTRGMRTDVLPKSFPARMGLFSFDVDYHHGNGTQAIFYERSDVHFASLHGDPLTDYPYYLGHADERGAGAGLGFNHNLPLARGTDFATWRAALKAALDGIAAVRAGALVVSLGVDTFEGDPIAGFRLRSDDYLRMGEDLARAGLPTVFVFEGGYAVAEVGVNAVNVLQGFKQQAAG